jgi:hypothetical protein
MRDLDAVELSGSFFKNQAAFHPGNFDRGDAFAGNFLWRIGEFFGVNDTAKK